jgi:hypothetical protein
MPTSPSRPSCSTRSSVSTRRLAWPRPTRSTLASGSTTPTMPRVAASTSPSPRRSMASTRLARWR